MHGHVAVYDVAVRTVHAKGVEYVVYDVFVDAQLEVVALLFTVRGLVFYEVALKGCHLRLVKQRAVGAAPQVEEVVYGVVAVGGGRVFLEGGAYLHAYVVEQLAAFAPCAGTYFHLFQCAVIVEWYGGVEQQVVVEDGKHAAVLQYDAYVLV